MKKKDDLGFVQGWVAAVATMVKSHDIGNVAEEAMRDIGVQSIADLRKYKCDEYDIECLRGTIKFMQSSRRYQKQLEKMKAKKGGDYE